jgi:anti-anti-sigma factor
VGDSEVQIEFEGDIAILAVVGQFVGDETSTLRGAMKRVLDLGHQKIIVDFSRTTKMDSGGIGELAAAYRAASDQDARMVVVSPEGSLGADVLIISQLCQIFEIYYSREEALEALGYRKEEGGGPREGDPINTYEVDGITVVEPRGRLGSGSRLGKALRKLGKKLIDAGRRHFVLDLKGAKPVDEATALEIIAFHTMAAQEDCITLLADLSKELNGSLEAQAFDPTQDGGPYESVDSAIDSLKTTLGL